ncbi:MAG: hypothetical protein BMS9Abin37_0871 [Acidobacteriota bacterium]|nr:MAG: hypothetical protein BMS9Abin37_0871 [Acidobacteriota bacterium]
MTKSEETRLLANALRDPVELRKKLVLAIALAPPLSLRRGEMMSRRSKNKSTTRRRQGK